ncbi:hypothetical protein E0L36_26235 [Streptomyces sp. AJS327]|uniref:hypothetical protein n=1 Tax=Streptomyces sp. AJS327 TaxID=2545265 RepID=UPI0015DD5E39|nr:hypothetical protein [Streptomyces sp. AJS327]MBA0054225.1 hypothetical protein [Streptomyces sp. AJS327]
MVKAGHSSLSAHRRPLFTAAAAGGLLTALCFLPTAHAVPEDSGTAERAEVADGARFAAGPHADDQLARDRAAERARGPENTDRRGRPADSGADERITAARADAPGTPRDGAAEARAERDTAATESAADSSMPYALAGLGLLGAGGAWLVTRSIRAPGRAAPRAATRPAP